MFLTGAGASRAGVEEELAALRRELAEMKKELGEIKNLVSGGAKPQSPPKTIALMGINSIGAWKAANMLER